MENRVFKIILPLYIVTGLLLGVDALAGPEEDRLVMANYYSERFPDVPMQEFANGLYAFDGMDTTSGAGRPASAKSSWSLAIRGASASGSAPIGIQPSP